MGQGIFLLLLLTLLGPLVDAVALSQNKSLYVGEPFQFDFSEHSGDIRLTETSDGQFPSWLLWNTMTKILQGVPGMESMGSTYLKVAKGSVDTGDTIDLHIRDETKNPCGNQPTMWFEIFFDKTLNELSVDQRIRIVVASATSLGTKWDDLRLYSNAYLSNIRDRYVHHNTAGEPKADTAVLTWKYLCMEDDDDADVILMDALAKAEELFSSAGLNFIKKLGYQITEGRVLQRQQRFRGGGSGKVMSGMGFSTNIPPVEPTRVETTTKPTTPVTRDSRTSVRIDQPPVLMKQLDRFTCESGNLCEIIIPENTFHDAEEGSTRNLSLSVSSLLNDSVWLTVTKKKDMMRGVPLEAGSYTYRLDARDKKNQLKAATVMVLVTGPKAANHEFVFSIAVPFKDLQNNPEARLDLFEKLRNLHREVSANPQGNILIRRIEKGKKGMLVVAWTDPVYSGKMCSKEHLNGRKQKMINNDAIQNVVNTQMLHFPVKYIKLDFIEECAVGKKVKSDVDNGTTTVSSPAASEPTVSFASSPLLLPLAIATLVLLLILICLITWCIIKRKNPKTVQSEFVSKGLPVVFPEEIPQDDEAANASTPMLVKEERPPLVISQHENPLYKPPPPLSTASSPRPRNTPTNQRLPPPYVPP